MNLWIFKESLRRSFRGGDRRFNDGLDDENSPLASLCLTNSFSWGVSRDTASMQWRRQMLRASSQSTSRFLVGWCSQLKKYECTTPLPSLYVEWRTPEEHDQQNQSVLNNGVNRDCILRCLTIDRFDCRYARPRYVRFIKRLIILLNPLSCSSERESESLASAVGNTGILIMHLIYIRIETKKEHSCTAWKSKVKGFKTAIGCEVKSRRSCFRVAKSQTFNDWSNLHEAAASYAF